MGMQRRTFLYGVLGFAAVGLYGCGDSGQSFVATGTSVASRSSAQEVTGRIDPDIQAPNGVIGSSFGPSTVQGQEFQTSISGTGVGLLTLEDNQGGVRGFTLTFPGESPRISFESTALAIVFMEPGYLKLESEAAREQIARIEASPAFETFVGFLRQNASTRLDLLSGESDYVALLEALLDSLGTPYTNLANPVFSRVGASVQITNPSPRFLTVQRGNVLLDRLLPPFGVLLDTPSGPTLGNYTLQGLGSDLAGRPDDAILDQTFLPSVFFASVLPLLELAAGVRIPPEQGLAILEGLETTVAPLGDAAFVLEPLSLAVQQATALTIGDVAESITDSFTAVSKLVTAGSYLAGLGFSIGAIMKFKQHKDNPTQVPIGTPIALVFIAAALLFLPSIIGKLGSTVFEGSTAAPSGPVFDGGP